ncbi:MAG: DUF3147 family protein [Patescibacteria group bacterium]
MNLFVLQVIVSFIVGGFLIGLITLIAERVSLKYRGIVLTIPTTLAVSLFFIGLTKSPMDVSQAVVTATAGLLISFYIFVLVFAFFSQKRNFILGAILSFVIWGFCTFLILTFTPSTFLQALIIGIPFFVVCYFLIRKLPQETEITPVDFNIKHILLRSFLAGSVIATTVILAKLFGNAWGGIFANFPASNSTALFIYYFAHGKKVIPSICKSFFFPGAIGLILYGFTAGVVFPLYGIWWGTLISYFVVGIFLFLWVQFSKILNKNKIIAELD